MDDLPLAPLVAGAAVLVVGPVRRRVLPVARATARAGAGVVGATVAGTFGILSAAVRGDATTGTPTA